MTIKPKKVYFLVDERRGRDGRYWMCYEDERGRYVQADMRTDFLDDPKWHYVQLAHHKYDTWFTTHKANYTVDGAYRFLPTKCAVRRWFRENFGKRIP